MPSNDSDERDQPPAGLRERKKVITREAISAAALRLALENGPGNVRVEDIATEAGVSPRTYNNYFASREQAIIAGLLAESSLRMGAALWRRPKDEPLHVAVREALVDVFNPAPRPGSEAIELIVVSDPLRAEFARTVTAIEVPLAKAIAERLPQTADVQTRADLLAAAVAAVARRTAERWLDRPSGRSLATAIRRSLDLLSPALQAAADDPPHPRQAHP